MAQRVILVRHGETDWNKEKRIQGGSSDPLLNETGRQQAEGLARRLGQEPIEAIYSSPLKRSLDTATAIARRHQLEVVVEPSLREIEAGTLEGVLTGSLNKRLSQLLTADAGSDALPKPPGGESLADVQRRAWSTIQRLSQKHPHRLVVVSHYFVILSVICSVLGLPLSQLGRFRMENGSISIINLDGQVAWLELYNDAGYPENGE
jgi:probable phosphoglycerate mutase